MSILACTYKVDIDRLIHPPSHGKDEVDGLNAVTKRYLQLCMYNTANTTDENLEDKFEPWTYNGNTPSPVSEQAIRLCTNSNRRDGVTSVRKYQKQENSKSVVHRCYMSFKHEEVPFSSLTMRTINFNQKYDGKKLKKHGCLRSRYNIRVDPDLGVGKAAIRRVSLVLAHHASTNCDFLGKAAFLLPIKQGTGKTLTVHDGMFLRD